MLNYRFTSLFKFKQLLIFVFILSYNFSLYAQPNKVFTSSKSRKALTLYSKATELLMVKNYKDAEIILNNAIKADPNYVDAYMRLSSIYYKTGKIEKEKAMYEKALELKPEYPNVNFNYAYLLMRETDYENAIKYFKIFAEFGGTSQRFQKKAYENIELCKFRIHQMKHPVPYKLNNAGKSINTELDEYWPVLTADDGNLFFTRKLLANKSAKVAFAQFNEDIFISDFKNNDWTNTRPLPGFLNSPNKNEGAISISPDGNSLYFTICSEDRNLGYGWCDIYYSEYRRGKWQAPKNIGQPINTRGKETQPSISFDGKTIYFSANREGSVGKLDIWKSTKLKNGKWSEPVNLGPRINTKGNEQSPFIHSDDQTLYFSTDKRKGMGESDIFIARRLPSGEFGMVTNLGYPLNSHKSELGIFVSASGRKAFVASRKEGGEGGLDIYDFKMPNKFKPRPVCYLKGVVYDADTKQKLGARFELINLSTGKLIVESRSDPITGKFLVAIPSDKDYALNVSRKGYLFYSDNFSIKGIKSTAFEKDVPLLKIKIGQTIILKNVFFDFDKFTLKDESRAELKKTIQFLYKYPKVKVELSGYTDNKGSSQYNKTLSQNRAKTVYNYLIKNGKIPASRLS
ncbi:MAG: OmpA family protein, partial [Bacteroidota bacterium]|nr:OmpA family protein [Bacteroidota bacterium]